MNAHVCRRRRVAQQLSSGTTRVLCWIRRGGIPIHVRLGPRPVGWTGRPGLVTHRPTRGHPPALPIGAHAVEASGLSRDVSTQVAASRTLPPHVGVGGRPPSHLEIRGDRATPCPRSRLTAPPGLRGGVRVAPACATRRMYGARAHGDNGCRVWHEPSKGSLRSNAEIC